MVANGNEEKKKKSKKEKITLLLQPSQSTCELSHLPYLDLTSHPYPHTHRTLCLCMHATRTTWLALHVGKCNTASGWRAPKDDGTGRQSKKVICHPITIRFTHHQDNCAVHSVPCQRPDCQSHCFPVQATNQVQAIVSMRIHPLEKASRI